MKKNVQRALREQRPDPWEEAAAGARSEEWLTSSWRRLCLRAFFVIRAVASSLILGEFENLRQEQQRRSLLAAGFTGQEATLVIEAGQESGPATAHSRSKEYHGPTGRGKALSISKGKFSRPAEQCEHPTESVKPRGNNVAIWWTCVLCGSRWERVEEALEDPYPEQPDEAAGEVLEDPYPEKTDEAANWPTSSAVGSGEPSAARNKEGKTESRPSSTGSFTMVPPTKPPTCFCGHRMALKANRKDGGAFYGCTTYPKCQFTRKVWFEMSPSAAEDQEMLGEAEEEVLEQARNITTAMMQQGASWETAMAAVAHALNASQMDRLVRSLPR